MSRIHTLARLSLSLPLLLTGLSQPAAAQFPPTVLLPGGTLNQTTTPGVTVILTPNYSASLIQFFATFKGVPSGYSINNNTYAGWCVDPFSDFAANPPYNLISSYDSTSLNNPPGGGRAKNPNWNAVNWVLNNKPTTGTAKTWIIQQVIWKLLSGRFIAYSPDLQFYPAPAPAPFPLSGGDSAIANALYAAAITQTSFVPSVGQVAGVMLYVDGINPDGTSTSSNYVVNQNGINPAAPPLNGLNGRTNQFQDVLIEVPVGPASIGDFVWQDTNQNGVQDAGEPGINGVTVKLCADSSCNTVLATTTTANQAGNDGYYQFTGFPLGTYFVSVDTTQSALSGLVPTLTGQGSAATDSNLIPSMVTLTAGSPTDQTIDFGFTSPGTSAIGDFVWQDNNANGIQDNGEPGLSGLTVNLCSDASCTKILRTTVTDQSGAYHFTGLFGGIYYVQVIAGAGFAATTAQAGYPGNAALDSGGNVLGVPMEVNLPVNYTDNTIDFGFVPPAQGVIGDFVWLDMNSNGIQDAGEPGINNITLRLYDANNNLVATTTTMTNSGQDGYYQFTGLAAGSYTVRVDNTTVPSTDSPATVNAAGSTGANDSNGTPAAVTLPTNISKDLTIDFGYVPPCTGSIGDFVWNDLNRNGIQDFNEPGIPNVIVNLYGPNHVFITSTTTDQNGAYHFSGLCAGSFTVEVVPPAGYLPTTSTQGGDRAADSNGSPAAVTLLQDNSTDGSIDFGYYQLGALTTNVFNDLNNNGTKDSGEANLAGWTITTTGPNSYSNTGVTDANGNVALTNLAPGNYQVCITAQASWTQTTPAGACQNVTVVAGQTANDIFGEVQLGSLTTNVFNDVNQNGTKDSGESNLAGWTVTTTGPGGYTNAGVTDANGNVSLANLTPGAYQVCITQQANWTETTPVNVCQSVNVSANQTATDFFGEVQLGNLTTNVFNDLNNNGAKDSGEGNLAGWAIATTGPGGFSTTGTTDASGNVSLTNLTPGPYQVCITQQPNWTATTPASLCQSVTVVANQTATDYFGEVQLGGLTTNVFNDLNKNGVKNAGEGDLGGWTITTTGPGGYSNTGTTDANGNVALTSLTPGAYQVCITQQANWTETTPAALCQNVTVLPNHTASDVFGEVQLGNLTANVFNDLNQNGVKDAGEGNLTGWTITTTGPNSYTNTGTTDSNGNVSLTALVPGAYQVCITQQATWTETTPAGLCQTLTVVATQTVSGIFGEVQLGNLTTNVFNDLNKSGVKDAGEGNLAGWTITTTGPNNYSNTSTTDSGGNVALTNLVPGAYQVCITQQATWTETTPAALCQNVTVIANQTATDLFGEIQLGNLTANVFNDLNQNGTKEAGEGNLAGWTITTTGAGGYSNTGTTDAGGNVALTGLTPGSYQLCITQQASWTETTPAGLCQNVTVVANQTASGIFGEVQLGNLTTNVFNDLNKNAAKDAGEGNLAGWTITTTGPGGYTNTGATDANGNVSLTALTPGAYQVCITQQAAWTETTPAGFCQNVTVIANQTATDLFGEVQLGNLTTNVFNDLNKNAAKDAGEGNLAGWTITTTGPGGYTNTGATDANGNVSLTGLTPGAYQVCITQQANWIETTPASLCQNITVVANQTSTDFFGEVQLGNLTTNVFNDLNKNAAKDAGEGNLAGWTITTTGPGGYTNTGATDANGNVSLTGLTPGAYQVCITQQANWIETTPASLCQNITVVANQTSTDFFGEVQLGNLTTNVFNDVNKNAAKDAGEANLGGWTITTTGPNGYTNTGSTDANGNVSLTGLTPGVYQVCITQKPNWIETTPASVCQSVTVVAGQTASDLFGEVLPPLLVTCAANNISTQGVPFTSGPMSVTGGTGSYTFSIVGTLPAGLTLNTANGSISGTPTTSGTFSIQVKDSAGAIATGCQIIINPPPSVNCSTKNSGEAGIAFNSPAMSVSGGTGPFTFSVATGTLPAGLTLNPATGAIMGTTTSSGSFTIKVTDSKGAIAAGTCPFVIAARLSVACSAVTSGLVGSPFSSPALGISGGVGPYVFSVASGTLPAGLTLNVSNGTVTGTPTAAGTFTLAVTDGLGAVAIDICAFTISAPLPSCQANLGPLTYNVNESGSSMAGEVVWFNSHLTKLGGTIPTSDFQIFVRNGKIVFGTSTLTVPNAVITFTSSASCASTSFDTATNTWQTKIPLSAAGSADEIFAAGLAYQLPANFAQNVSNVTWSATIYSSAPGLQVSWQYGVSNWLTQRNGTSFPLLAGGQPDYNAMMIDPAHNAPLCNSAYNSGDHAGTPEFAGRANVLTGGGSGGGGSNWTGSWSSTSQVSGFPCAVPVGTGDTATIGYWHNKNGQALILSLNGGANSKALGNWLAAQFPYLYGVNSPNNMANQTNTAVAALFMTFFNQSGQKTYAQIMGGALAAYVTSSTLAGNNAVQYGFNSSTGGTGAKTYNVGTSGSAIGLSNGGSYTVLQLLQQANSKIASGTFNADAFNTVFDGINTSGDII